jgi:hypothetical protein
LINNRQAGRRRGRGGNNNGGGGNGNGPRTNQGQRDNGNRIDSRARGNANQLYEKYKNLASDAQRQGDRVNTEYYLQFADHYFRVLSETRNRFEEQNQQRRQQNDGYEAQAFTGSFDTGFDSQDDEFGDEGEPIRAGEQAFGEDRGGDRDGNRGGERDGNQRDGQRGEGQRDSQRGDRQNGQAPQTHAQNAGHNGSQNPDRPRRDGRVQRDGNRQPDDAREGGGERGQREAQPRYEGQRGQREEAPRDGASRDAEPRRAPRGPRRDREEAVPDVAVGPQTDTLVEALPAPIGASVSTDAGAEPEAPRRRGRPRRERPVDDEPAAFDAALLPPSLGIAPAATTASADESPAEDKPRRRRMRAVVEAPPAAE